MLLQRVDLFVVAVEVGLFVLVVVVVAVAAVVKKEEEEEEVVGNIVASIVVGIVGEVGEGSKKVGIAVDSHIEDNVMEVVVVDIQIIVDSTLVVQFAVAGLGVVAAGGAAEVAVVDTA